MHKGSSQQKEKKQRNFCYDCSWWFMLCLGLPTPCPPLKRAWFGSVWRTWGEVNQLSGDSSKVINWAETENRLLGLKLGRKQAWRCRRLVPEGPWGGPATSSSQAWSLQLRQVGVRVTSDLQGRVSRLTSLPGTTMYPSRRTTVLKIAGLWWSPLWAFISPQLSVVGFLSGPSRYVGLCQTALERGWGRVATGRIK